MSERFTYEETPTEPIVSTAYANGMKLGSVAVSRFGSDDTVLISYTSGLNGYMSGMLHLTKEEALDLSKMLKLVAGEKDA